MTNFFPLPPTICYVLLSLLCHLQKDSICASMLSCGTLYSTSLLSLMMLLIQTYCFLLFRWLSNNFKVIFFYNRSFLFSVSKDTAINIYWFISLLLLFSEKKAIVESTAFSNSLLRFEINDMGRKLLGCHFWRLGGFGKFWTFVLRKAFVYLLLFLVE